MTLNNNKRIAKNSLILSLRMLLILIISLYITRLVLNTLGVIDFGIYNVVGGIVLMISFLSNTLGAASQRFFAIEIGRNNFSALKNIFSLSVTIYIIISLIVLLFAETIGLWFLNSKMVIPIDRIEAANWIYQFTVFSFIINILTIPYNSIIIAHEDMTVYAFIGIIEVVLKLIMVFILIYLSIDKLKLYAVLMFAITCIITLMNIIVCSKKYKESHFHFFWDKKIFSTLLSFSGWNLFGAISGVINSQGINILLNVFFGPIINTARGIAYQVGSAVSQFVMNFQTSVNPQITKYYAADDKKEMMFLVFKSSKFSFFIFFTLSMPVILETNYILELWLNRLPEYVVLFTRLVIINILIDTLSYSLQTAALATGEIKKYQMVVGGVMLLNLPISYFFLKIGFMPEVTIYISIILSIICLLLRTWVLKSLVNFSVIEYYKKVILVVIVVSLIAYIIPFILYFKMESSVIRFIIVGSTSLLTSIASIYIIGMDVSEKRFLNEVIKEKIIKKYNFKSHAKFK